MPTPTLLQVGEQLLWVRAAPQTQIPEQGGAQSPHQCLTPHPDNLMALFEAARLQTPHLPNTWGWGLQHREEQKD